MKKIQNRVSGLPFIKVSTQKKNYQNLLNFDKKLAFFYQCSYTLFRRDGFPTACGLKPRICDQTGLRAAAC